MINLTDPANSVLVYADGAFSNKAREKYPLRAKTADGYIRYATTRILGVIDASSDEGNVSEVLGIRDDIPIYHSLVEYVENGGKIPAILLIGVAPSGGGVDNTLLRDIRYAIEHGINIVSGMHYELNNDTELKKLADMHQVSMWDVRVPPDDIAVASCKAYQIKKPIVLTCASDAAIGKMTVGFELERILAQRNMQGELIATGQTAIMVKGKGISIDRVIGDFMPGAVEKLLIESEKTNPANRFYLIEGQGGLLHPGYAPVTLALLHGGMPTHAILIHRPQRKHSIGSKLIKLPDPVTTMQLYKQSALPIRIPIFLGIALHTKGMGDDEAKDCINRIHEETELPVEDMIRFPTGALADALESAVVHYEAEV